MPLNKNASWGPPPVVARPPLGLATVVNQSLAALAGQPPLGPRIDAVTAAVTAGDPNAAIAALGGALAPLAALTALRDLEQLAQKTVPHFAKLEDERNHELHCIADALQPLQNIARDIEHLRQLAERWAGGGKPPGPKRGARSAGA